MIVGWLFLVGLALGSFINALVWRVYQQSLPPKKRAASSTELSISSGRSMCTHCKHILSSYDLVPVLSWLSLRGKCRYCKSPISAQYPLVELLTAFLFVASYLFWPTELILANEIAVFGLWLAFLVGLVALAIYDVKWMLLPNRIVFPVTILATLKVLLMVVSASNPFDVLLSALGGLAIAGGLFYVLFQISDGKWIGGGDVKLGFALGLMLGGPYLAFLMLFIASLVGLFIALPDIMRKSSVQRRIPFGPSLITATIICMLFGQAIIDWYTSAFLYL